MPRTREPQIARAAIALIVLAFMSLSAPAETPPGLAAFVTETASDIAASPLHVAQFKGATLDAVEDLGPSNGINRYLCWLKTDPNRIGYLAVGSDGKSFQVLAFSASTLSPGYFGYEKGSHIYASSPVVSSPGYFLKHLEVAQPSPKSLDFSRMEHVSFVENVPLVPAARTLWGTQPIEMSEMAASLSSLFNYIQKQPIEMSEFAARLSSAVNDVLGDKGILFFGRRNSEWNPEYLERMWRDSAAGRVRPDSNRESLELELLEVMKRENIPQGQTEGEQADYRVRMRNVTKPLIRQRLLDPNNACERLEALQAEQKDNVTIIDISQGMRDAIYLQMDYLADDRANIKQSLDLFLKTRGRTASISIVPFAKTHVDSLPTVLIGPDNIAALVLGSMEIDGEHFSLVFFPKTGRPNRMSMADRSRARGAADRLADPNRGKNAKEREGLARLRKMEETTMLVEDPDSKLPDSLSAGVHMCRTSSLAQWQAIDIGKIEVGPNWGKPETK
jgi:hypothetical protein